MYRYGGMIQSVPLFKDTSIQFRNMLALSLEPIHVAANTWIFKEGDDAFDMYFIVKGKVEIIVPSKMGGESHVDDLEMGDYFGDVSLLREAQTRNVSARTKTNADLGRLSKRKLKQLLIKFPEIDENMKKIMAEKWRRSMQISQSLEANEKQEHATKKKSGSIFSLLKNHKVE
jgi:CRP-like cAMP-binding protein